MIWMQSRLYSEYCIVPSIIMSFITM
ncbi:hypothetical protein DFA_05950 [Cavenderia fasciculata]|uniref:Uncharacterized protein n=1 Tax=Cavenderia fasciculata TaxID=261658 RepID=F4PJP0_CACFS|nr:hypothetical protein DFA_05950 [Cavenderia fasciculata]EGG23814.1 hypothetical protein DFA_05950 [Cavenderia fasciculata]|eukprot:XP_004361665.1 hypothetical protein DFA_05950 [Cavenderia fasciculata]